MAWGPYTPQRPKATTPRTASTPPQQPTTPRTSPAPYRLPVERPGTVPKTRGGMAPGWQKWPGRANVPASFTPPPTGPGGDYILQPFRPSGAPNHAAIQALVRGLFGG